MKFRYTVLEGYDGGSVYYFDDLVSARCKAVDLTVNLRFTLPELNRLICSQSNFIDIFVEFLDCDGDVYRSYYIDSLRFGLDTLRRIY